MVLGGLSHAKTQVQHSGQFSGSSGAMGGKKPYLIVSRPQTRTPQRIAEYEGIPTNSIHQLMSCTGFTKVKEVHITSKNAYDNEIQEIEALLKSGVLISD
jgi:FMN-dependent NADH-azoreductase